MMVDYSFEEDLYIRKELSNLYIPVPEGFDEFINAKIEEGMALAENNEKKHRHLSKGMIAVLVAIMVLAIGVAVTASMDYYHKRMNMLSEQEINQLLSDLDQSNEEAALYSRPLSEEERNRSIILQGRYLSEGLFPENSLRIINSLEEARKDEVSFYPPKSFYYLPERPLTDEELLEMLDYTLKADYALRKRAEDNQPAVSLDEEALKEKALNAIEKVFDIELKDYSVSIEKQIAFENEGKVSCPCTVTIYDKKYRLSYTVMLEGVSGKIETVDLLESSKNKMNVPYVEEECLNAVKTYKDKAYNLHENKSEIERMYIKTERRDASTIDGKNIILDYKFNDGTWCRFYYSFSNRQIISWEDGLDDYSIEYDDDNEQKRCNKIGHEYIIVEVN